MLQKVNRQYCEVCDLQVIYVKGWFNDNNLIPS